MSEKPALCIRRPENLVNQLKPSIDVPYPSPADRKDLEELVKKNWESYVTEPASKTVEEVSDSFNDAKEWIFDSWVFINPSK